MLLLDRYCVGYTTRETVLSQLDLATANCTEQATRGASLNHDRVPLLVADPAWTQSTQAGLRR